MIGRYCAKQALSASTHKKDLTDILIENGVFQQPIVYYPTHKNPQVSISHTDTLGAALAFPEAHPMAIDVETINTDKDNAIQTQLTNHERRLLSSLSNTMPPQLLWTVKEALSKILKCGLMIPFELLEVEDIIQQENFCVSHFKNLQQYKALSFLLAENVCSLVYPKKTRLNLDILYIQKRVGSFKQ